MADDDLTTKEAFDQTAQAAFRGIAEIAKAHPAIAHNEPAKAFLTVFLPVVGLSVSRTAQRFLAIRLRPLSEGYAKAFGDDPKKIEENTREHEDDPDYHEVMFRTFRAMTDAVDPEVIEILGHLAGQYNYAARKPDAYFRSLGRLLCELDPGEVGDLVSILRGVEAASKEDESADVTFGTDESVSVYKAGASNLRLGTFASGLRLFALLRREGLATNTDTPLHWGDSEVPAADRAIRMRRGMVRNILSTIDPKPPER